jgi:hypothetical protein
MATLDIDIYSSGYGDTSYISFRFAGGDWFFWNSQCISSPGSLMPVIEAIIGSKITGNNARSSTPLCQLSQSEVRSAIRKAVGRPLLWKSDDQTRIRIEVDDD